MTLKLGCVVGRGLKASVKKMRLLYCLLVSLFFLGSEGSEEVVKTIATPDNLEHNRFAINVPTGWAYRTFKGNNGLIGVLWPKNTSFSKCDTAVFIFIQDFDEEFLPEVPENVHLFKEKCSKAEFKFALLEDDQDKTKSIEEKYFSGHCGRTEILFEEKVENFRIIGFFASSFDVSRDLYNDVEAIVSAYKKEVKTWLDNQKTRGQKNRGDNFEN